jgi:hypothetical protein
MYEYVCHDGKGNAKERTKHESSRAEADHKKRTMGEQNKVYHTTMYVRAAQAQHTKGVRRFLAAQTGLDTACYALRRSFPPIVSPQVEVGRVRF